MQAVLNKSPLAPLEPPALAWFKAFEMALKPPAPSPQPGASCLDLS